MMDCFPAITVLVKMMLMKMMVVSFVVSRSLGGGANSGTDIHSLRLVSRTTSRGQRAPARGGR